MQRELTYIFSFFLYFGSFGKERCIHRLIFPSMCPFPLFLRFCFNSLPKILAKLSIFITQIRLNIKCLITYFLMPVRANCQAVPYKWIWILFNLFRQDFHRQLCCLFVFLSPPAIPALCKFEVFMSLIPHIFYVLWNHVLPRSLHPLIRNATSLQFKSSSPLGVSYSLLHIMGNR